MKDRAKYLRNNSTLSEVILWKYLKNKKLLGYDFHRQKPIDNYIVDFYCPKLHLAIEIDGSSHNDKIEYDKRRNIKLESLGINVIHFRDIDVKINIQGVLDFIEEWILGNSTQVTHPDFSTKNHPSQEGIYQGVKFRTNFISNVAPEHSKLSELIKWCKIFHKENLAPPYPGGSSGNLSFRIKSGESKFIITGSRIGLKNSLTNNSFVEVLDCNLNKKVVSINGLLEPSSETMLHFAVYQEFPDINAIFHGHKFLENSPTTKKEEAYGTIELVNEVLETMKENKVINMKNHGFISIGENIEEAGGNVVNSS